MRSKSLLILAAVAMSAGGLSSTATAGSVSADGAARGAPATGGNGTTDLFAFSQIGTLTNQTAQYSLIPPPGGGATNSVGCSAGGPLQCPSPAPSPPSPPGSVTYIVVEDNEYGPAVGVRGQRKVSGLFYATQSVSSSTTTLAIPGNEFSTISANGTAQYQRQSGMVVAVGRVSGPNQKAAGAAFDPFTLSGPMTFPNYQYVVDGSFQVSNPGDQADITYFALDSRLTNPASADAVDNFYGATAPLDQAPWSLTIVDNGPLTSLSDLMDPTKLVISFVVNPAAIRMGILRVTDAMGNVYTASGLDAAIDGSVRADFAFVDDAATISSFDLFPEMPSPANLNPPLEGNTTYSVAGTVRYGDAVDVGVAAVPELSTWAMIVAGFGALGFARFRRDEPKGAQRASAYLL